MPNRLLAPIEPEHAAEGIELGHKEVAVLVDGDAVRRRDHARLPLLRFDLVASDTGLGIGAEPYGHLARLVEDRDLALQLTNDRVVTVDGDSRGKEQVLGHDTEELAIEREVNHAVIRAIAP